MVNCKRLAMVMAAFVMVVLSPRAALAVQRLAVLELTGDGTIDDPGLVLIADKIRTESLLYLDRDQWQVLTRENMLVLLEANAANLAACEGECEVETGRLLGAQIVVVGRAMQFGTRYTVILNTYDTDHGELMRSAEATAPTLDGLWDELGRACREIFSDEMSAAPSASRPAVVESVDRGDSRTSTSQLPPGPSFGLIAQSNTGGDERTSTDLDYWWFSGDLLFALAFPLAKPGQPGRSSAFIPCWGVGGGYKYIDHSGFSDVASWVQVSLGVGEYLAGVDPRGTRQGVYLGQGLLINIGFEDDNNWVEGDLHILYAVHDPSGFFFGVGGRLGLFTRDGTTVVIPCLLIRVGGLEFWR